MSAHSPQATRRTRLSRLLRIAAGLSLCLLSGCAAMAVSLVGAGAGAGISHQINGQASRTFSEPLMRVDDAVRLAARRMLLDVEKVSTTEQGQITKAHVSDLEITVELQTLSPNLTRVDVVARKSFLRVDGATAQEIVTQIERSLETIAMQEAAAAAEAAAKPAKAELPSQSGSRKASPVKGKRSAI